MARTLTARQILRSMAKAPPSNAIKLTDSNEYSKVEYEEFFSLFPEMDFDKVKNNQLQELQNEMTYLTLKKDYNFRDDKLYIYFILRLQEILYDPN